MEFIFDHIDTSELPENLFANILNETLSDVYGIIS
jgi:hypothetical protein